MTFHRIIRRAKRHRDLKFLSEKKSRKVKPDKKSSLSELLTCFSSQTLFLRFRSDAKSSLFKA